jgi:hypothetical protein
MPRSGKASRGRPSCSSAEAVGPKPAAHGCANAAGAGCAGAADLPVSYEPFFCFASKSSSCLTSSAGGR